MDLCSIPLLQNVSNQNDHQVARRGKKKMVIKGVRRVQKGINIITVVEVCTLRRRAVTFQLG